MLPCTLSASCSYPRAEKRSTGDVAAARSAAKIAVDPPMLLSVCAVEVGRAKGRVSTPLNNIVECYYTYSSKKLKRVGRREQEPRAQTCYKPDYEWKIVDDKKYMLNIERPEYDQYRNMTAGPEKDAPIIEHADKVVDVSS